MVAVAAWAVWVAWTVNREGGVPPYQDTTLCDKNCRQGSDCECYQRSCDMTVQEYDRWPFPKDRP